jgi:hypothetical protein
MPSKSTLLPTTPSNPQTLEQPQKPNPFPTNSLARVKMSEQQDYSLSKWKSGINAAELDTDELNAFIDWNLTEYNKDKWRDDKRVGALLGGLQYIHIRHFQSLPADSYSQASPLTYEATVYR